MFKGETCVKIKNRTFLDGGYDVLKDSVRYALIFYVLLAAFQWLFEPKILWINNIGLAVLAMFIYLLLEWLIQLYRNKKNQK